MPTAPVTDDSGSGSAGAGRADTELRALTDAARRALAEAEERRRARDAAASRPSAPEVGGRTGPDPVRHGDWEKDGLASDF